MTTPSLRALSDPSPALLGELDTLLARAYGRPGFQDRVERFLAVQPGGWVVAMDGSQLVGCGGCVAYPDGGFGWIGLVAVDPGLHRSGIGRLVTTWLVEHLRSLGCASVLDGSASGAPLYARMGFADHGVSSLLRAPNRRAEGLSSLGPPARHILSSDAAAVYAYDRVRFGADRAKLLQYLFTAYPNYCFVAADANGNVEGFAVAQENSLGPFVADTVDAFDALLAATSGGFTADVVTIAVPPGSNWFGRFEQMGFTTVRELRRQHFGIGALGGRPGTIAGQCSFGEG